MEGLLLAAITTRASVQTTYGDYVTVEEVGIDHVAQFSGKT